MFELGRNYENWIRFAAENFPRQYWTIARYCLFLNRFDGNITGIAEDIPGQFFIVSQGLLYNDIQTAGTFMRELGHTLGLGHGGDDHDIYKPNYLTNRARSLPPL